MGEAQHQRVRSESEQGHHRGRVGREISICAQLASPAASGLFKRAINESGPCLPQPTMARAEERAGELVTKLDVAAMARAQGAEAIGPIASFSELDAALMIAVDSVCSGRVFVIDAVVENA